MPLRMLAIAVLALSMSVAVSVTPPTSFAQSGQFTIHPGVGIGPIRLGMNVQRDVVPLIGGWKDSSTSSDGTLYYAWFEHYKDSSGVNHGGGVGLWARQGVVDRMYVYHDPRYVIRGVHTGSSEAQVRSALGEPLRTMVRSTEPDHQPPRQLWYSGIMFEVGQTLTDPDGDYQRVFEIFVLQR